MSSNSFSNLAASLNTRTTRLTFGSLRGSSTNVSLMRWFSRLAVRELPNGTVSRSSGWSKYWPLTMGVDRCVGTSQAGIILQQIGSFGDPDGGFGHSRGDLTRSGYALWREDFAELRNQRFPADLRKMLGGADFQSFDLGRPDVLVGHVPQDQRRDSGPQAGGSGPGAAMVDGGAAHRQDLGVVDLADELH